MPLSHRPLRSASTRSAGCSRQTAGSSRSPPTLTATPAPRAAACWCSNGWPTPVATATKSLPSSPAARSTTTAAPTACWPPTPTRRPTCCAGPITTPGSTRAPSTTSRRTAPAPSSATRSRPTRWAEWSAAAAPPISPRYWARSSPTSVTWSRRPALPAWPRWRCRCTTTLFRRRSTTPAPTPTSTSMRCTSKSPMRSANGRATADTPSPGCPGSGSAAPTPTWCYARCCRRIWSSRSPNRSPRHRSWTPRSASMWVGC